MKRVTSVALLAAAMLLCAASGAVARNFDRQGKVQLNPPAGSPFPHASGWVAVSRNTVSWTYSIDKVSVSKLAPNARYFLAALLADFSSGEWVWTWEVVAWLDTDTRGSCAVDVGLWGRGAYGGFQVFDSTGTIVLSDH